MPVLQHLPPPDIKKFSLPFPDDVPEADRGWVIMDICEMNVSDSFVDAENNNTFADIGVMVLARRIKEWNFEVAEGMGIAPITPRNVYGLGVQNINFLVGQIPKDEVQPLTDAEKKTSISTSPTEEPVTDQPAA